jgi:small GTP-binding protein
MINENDNLIKKKICMLGAFAVGKTSLVRRFTENLFSEKYQTTIGVKVDKKIVSVSGQKMILVLWDLAGKDSISEMHTSYLRGASGYLLVIDRTRSNTLEVAQEIQNTARAALGEIPFIALINKWDLEEKWSVDAEDIANLQQQGWNVIKTSAKTGEGVNEAFETLAANMLLS